MANEAIEKTYRAPSTPPKHSSWSRIVDQLSPADKRILDVGCASGYLGRMIRRRRKGVELWGVDGNAEAVKKAKRYYDQALVINLNDKLLDKTFPGKFDVIIFADVLEHVLFPEEVLRYFAKKLKKGGRIIVSLPNVANWRVRFSLLLGSFNYQNYGVLDRTHLHIYTFRTARELVEAAGLKVVRAQPTANVPILGYLAMLPPLKGLIGIQVVTTAVHKDS